MDIPAPKLIETPVGARWCGPVLLAALPLQVLLGDVLLASSHSAWQLAYAGLASSLLLLTGLALLRLRSHRMRGIGLLVEATRRIGRRDFARLPHYTAAAASSPGLAPLGQACLQAAAQLRRRFARLESALEMDRWLLTVHDPVEMLRGVLPLASGILQGRSVSVALLSASDPGVRVLVLPENQGKGAAVLQGLEAAAAQGYTHALTLDSDGQHPTAMIGEFMAASAATPAAMILGEPQFDASAPSVRVKGRKISNWWANLETLWAGIHDSLFGFRVYPIAPLVQVMRGQVWMRRFDFDAEAVVRLAWRGVPAQNIAAPVSYFRADEGGVSHFRYGRDNVLLTWMHLRLFAGFLLRLPVLLARRLS